MKTNSVCFKVPAVEHRFVPPTIVPRQKCGTCAYKVPASSEELEMTVAYYIERSEAHPCHSRAGVFCLGAHEQVTELEKLVKRRINEKEEQGFKSTKVFSSSEETDPYRK